MILNYQYRERLLEHVMLLLGLFGVCVCFVLFYILFVLLLAYFVSRSPLYPEITQKFDMLSSSY